MSANNLPTGWCETVLGDVANWGSGGTPSRKNPDYYGGDIPWVKTGDLGPKILYDVSEFITEEAVANSSAKLFPKGSVAIAMYGATIGKTSILGIDATTNQACGVGFPIEEVTTKEFLYYFLCNEKDNFIAMGKGGAQPNISQALIKDHSIFLPPLAEQKEIARLLDGMLAQVDATKSRLDNIPEILKKFRQSVLSQAVSGKLTEEWRKGKQFDVESEIKAIQDKRTEDFEEISNSQLTRTGKKPRKPDYSCLNDDIPIRDIPHEWKLTQIGEIISLLTDYHANGSYKVLKEHVELKEEVDYACMIRATNFEKDNFDDLMIYISEEAYNFLNKSKLFGGEILVGKIGNAGCVYHMPHLNKPASLAMNLFAIRFDDELVNSKYIYLFLKSYSGETNIQKYVRGVATKSIDKKSLRSVYVNLPPLDEQKEIVRRVEELFAFADQIEARVNAASERVDKLTQSILAKAFRGDLTAQWRKDNPDLISGDNSAQALLARIKAERTSAKTTPKKRTTRKAKGTL